jgi:hypothetical protein
MNIFVLDENPELAAYYLCDEHIVKMCLETAQILSTVSGGPYKSTHANHPCTIWARSGSDNYRWLVSHGLAIGCEYTARFGKEHKSAEVIRAICEPPPTVPPGSTPFALAMPDQFRVPGDAVASYRRYYKSKSFATWKRSPRPFWWPEEIHPLRGQPFKGKL